MKTTDTHLIQWLATIIIVTSVISYSKPTDLNNCEIVTAIAPTPFLCDSNNTYAFELITNSIDTSQLNIVLFENGTEVTQKNFSPYYKAFKNANIIDAPKKISTSYNFNQYQAISKLPLHAFTSIDSLIELGQWPTGFKGSFSYALTQLHSTYNELKKIDISWTHKISHIYFGAGLTKAYSGDFVLFKASEEYVGDPHNQTGYSLFVGLPAIGLKLDVLPMAHPELSIMEPKSDALANNTETKLINSTFFKKHHDQLPSSTQLTAMIKLGYVHINYIQKNDIYKYPITIIEAKEIPFGALLWSTGITYSSNVIIPHLQLNFFPFSFNTPIPKSIAKISPCYIKIHFRDLKKWRFESGITLALSNPFIDKGKKQ